jgi:HSP20 family molecular chaperone IbpA
VSRKIPPIRLRQLEGQLGEVAYQITKIHFSGFHQPDVLWHPAINVFLCECCFRISVELAGVDPGEVELTAVPGHLWIRGNRDAPEPPATEGYDPVPSRKSVRVLAMEINYGRFEREVELPPDLVLDRASTEWSNGLLWISIPRRADA